MVVKPMRGVLDNQMTVTERFAEASRFFSGTGSVHATLGTVVAIFKRFNVDYAVIGALALNAHGYRRETTNIDVLVTREGLESLRSALLQHGFTPMAEDAREAFVDTSTRVTVDFFITGDFPGDRHVKPVAFPDPADVSVEIDGVNFVVLPTQIDLKLASGMNQPSRLRDLADVQDLIRAPGLGEDFAEELDPYVRDSYLTLLEETRQANRDGEDSEL